MASPARPSTEQAGIQSPGNTPIDNKGLARQRRDSKLKYREEQELRSKSASQSSPATRNAAQHDLLTRIKKSGGSATTAQPIGTKPEDIQTTAASPKKKDKPRVRAACEFDRVEDPNPLASFDSEMTKPFWAAMSKWSHDRKKEKDTQTNTRSTKPDKSTQSQSLEKKKRASKNKKSSETPANPDQATPSSSRTKPTSDHKLGETGTDKLNKSAAGIFKKLQDATGENNPDITPIMQGQSNLGISQKARRREKLKIQKIAEQDQVAHEEIQTGGPIATSRKDSAAPSEADTDDEDTEYQANLAYLELAVELNGLTLKGAKQAVAVAEKALVNAVVARGRFLVGRMKKLQRAVRQAERDTGDENIGTGDEKLSGDAIPEEAEPKQEKPCVKIEDPNNAKGSEKIQELAQGDDDKHDAYQSDASWRDTSWEEEGDTVKARAPADERAWSGPIIEK